MADVKKWKGTTFGSGWMLKSLTLIVRYVDVRLIYLFSDLFIVPVCLLLNRSCGVMYRFYRKGFHYGRLKSSLMTYRNHCRFSEVVIDRFAMYSGKHFYVEVEGHDRYRQLMDRPEGFVQLSSHIGNYELAGYSLKFQNKIMNALVYGGEKDYIMKSRNEMFQDKGTRMIAVNDGIDHLFQIDAALGRGEIVSMPSDRIFGSQKSVECDFLGNTACFPYGPFSVATARGYNAVAMNVMKTGPKRYRIHITELCYDREKPRKEQISELCCAYARELERIVRLYPLQWYNYFDFWKQ